jgi:hypothetical protein
VFKKTKPQSLPYGRGVVESEMSNSRYKLPGFGRPASGVSSSISRCCCQVVALNASVRLALGPHHVKNAVPLARE